MTFRIAKLELSTLFYSPIAWLLVIVFFFQCAFTYTNLIGTYLRLQELGGSNLPYMEFLTAKIFGSKFGVFDQVIAKIYLYLPLLTMGLISREVNSGTIKLLYSSPITIKEIVLGKFVAMAAYNLILISAVSIIGILGFINIPSFEISIFLSGMLGIFVLLCTYSAIGLFMSSLTSYQIVAAVSTLIVFGILDYIGKFGQGIDFFRNLTYFLSIAGRTDHMLIGLITTKDLVYFFTITAMFLIFTIIKLKSDRKTNSVVFVGSRCLLVLLMALTIGYISGIPGFIGYFDVTVGNRNTLTPTTQKILKEIGKDPLEVTFYVNLLDNRYRIGSPEQRNEDLDRWSKYLRFKSNIKLNYVYYYTWPLDEDAHFDAYYPGKNEKQLAIRFADSYGKDLKDFKTPVEIKKVIDLKDEQYRCVLQLKLKGKTTFLRLYDDMEVLPSETEIAAALKRLTVKLPTIVFLEDEYERSSNKKGPDAFGVMTKDITFRYSLINQGFNIENISLKERELPKDISTLVIGDPRTSFSPQALLKIQKYIAEGGNLLIAGEVDKEYVLKPLLDPLGIKMMDGTLLQQSKDYSLNMVSTYLSQSASELFKEQRTGNINMPGVVGLSYSNFSQFKVTPVLVTDPKTTWNKQGKVILDSTAVNYSPGNGDTRASVATMLALTRNVRGKEQRIIVSGDADFLTPASQNRKGNENLMFSTQLFRWFSYGKFPIDTSRPSSHDNGLSLNKKGLTTEKIITLGLLPGLFSIFGAVFLIRRRRK